MWGILTVIHQHNGTESWGTALGHTDPQEQIAWARHVLQNTPYSARPAHLQTRRMLGICGTLASDLSLGQPRSGRNYRLVGALHGGADGFRIPSQFMWFAYANPLLKC